MFSHCSKHQTYTCTYCSECLREALADKEKECERLRKGLDSVLSLIENSFGVDGLHKNGDVAPWNELRKGGRFDAWLNDFDEALEE